MTVPKWLPGLCAVTAEKVKLKLEGIRVKRMLDGVVANRFLGEWQGRGSLADAETSGLR